MLALSYHSVQIVNLLPGGSHLNRWRAACRTGATHAHAAHKALLRLRALGDVQAADEAMLGISMPMCETENAKKGLRSTEATLTGFFGQTC